MSGSAKKRAAAQEPTPIVTFYSYKGGVGRSMAVLNVASLIASRGFRVLIIDFDLEAPGLSHLIGKEAIPEKGRKSARKSPSKQILKPGVVELLSDAVLRGTESDLLSKPFPQTAEKYTFSYNPPAGLKQHPGAKLSIMPAGLLDEDYSGRLDQLDLPGLYKEPESSGKRLILRFREILISSGLYDYILVDSRTGHSDEAGICTRDLADHRMIVSGLNTQNITGTAAFLRNLRSALVQEGKELKTPDIILSPVPNGEDDLVSKREDKARHEFQAAWQSTKLQINLLIPYHPRLALTEEAYVPAITASPLRNAYLEIEDRVLRSLGHTPGPLEEEFRSRVKAGDGPAALHIIRRLVRLQRTPQFPGQIPVRTVFRFGLGYEEDFLKQISQLDEALDILKLYAENHSGWFDTTAVGRKLHELHPELAARYDQFVLKMDRLHPDELGNYAIFLKDIRKDHDAAEAFYKRALDLDSISANKLGNFGQFLIGRGRIEEGMKSLRASWEKRDSGQIGNNAEIAYSLWLGNVLAGKEVEAWERVFKHFIKVGFIRHVWNFDAMLAQAAKKLESADFKYAKCLAEAFLDESKIPVLEKFKRWKQLRALDPAHVNADGTIGGD